jgi:hypothetical protein
LTINGAIGKASTGDTIVVAAGTYPELVDVNKTLVLNGAQAGVSGCASSRTGPESVVTGSSGSTAFHVTANNVTIDGFTVQDQTVDNHFGAGIVLGGGTSGAHVVNNIVQNNVVGLFLSNNPAGNAAVVQRNKFSNNNQPGAAGGSGIYTDEFVAGGALANMSIQSNCFFGNDDAGIDFSASTAGSQSNITMANNLFDSNGRAFFLFNVTSSAITGNTVTNSSMVGSGDIRLFGGVDGLSITCNSITGGDLRAIRINDGFGGSPNPNKNISAHLNYLANDDVIGLELLPGGYSPETAGALNAENNRWKAATGPAPGEIVAPDSVVDSVPFLAGVPLCAAGFPFRGILRPADINPGPDVCGTGHAAINFTGGGGAGGSTWLTLYDTTPGESGTKDVFGSVSLSVDLIIRPFNGVKGDGLVALFNEAANKKGLVLVVNDAGNSDVLGLGTISQAGQIITLKAVSLGASIKECAWYRLTMDVTVIPPSNVTVTGKVFAHNDASDPNSGTPLAPIATLSYTNQPRPAGVDPTGQVGIMAAAYSTIVDSSVTNFATPVVP